MSKAFEGTINVGIRDSVPDWAPFEPPKAPEGAPNVCAPCSTTPASPP
jgi:arylsulfatase